MKTYYLDRYSAPGTRAMCAPWKFAEGAKVVASSEEEAKQKAAALFASPDDPPGGRHVFEVRRVLDGEG